jgi:hypothetical protein
MLKGVRTRFGQDDPFASPYKRLSNVTAIDYFNLIDLISLKTSVF